MTLSCNASGNPMPTTFSWTVNGSAVTVGGRISLSQDDKQLTITNVTRGDSGQYRCVANNTVGNVTSNAATLNVQCKNTLKIKNIKKLTLAKNVMLDVSATAVAFFSKRLKLQMSNGVLMVHDMC